MISEDHVTLKSNDAENTALITAINYILHGNNISEFDCFYCICIQINAGLVRNWRGEGGEKTK